MSSVGISFYGPVFLIVIGGIALIVLRQFGLLGQAQARAYVRRRPLTEVETKLYARLLEALPAHAVFAQVALSRVIEPKPGLKHLQAFRAISQKSVDFLVCDPAMNVVCAIELDDQTHGRADRRRADVTKSLALASAGVKLVRWQAKALPSVGEIAQAVLGSEPP